MTQFVDDYIADFIFDPLIQEKLEFVRNTVKKILPSETSEVIYHGVPTFMLHGKDIFSYGAYKNHITLYIGYHWVGKIKERYPQYRYSKAAMMIRYDEPIPQALLEDICSGIIQSI